MITYITRTTGSKWKSRLTLGIFATSFSFLKQQGASNKPNKEIYSTTKKPKKKLKNLKSSFAREFLHISLCLDMGTRLGPWNRRASNIHNKPDFPHWQTRIRMKTANMGLKPPVKPKKTTRAKCVSWKLDTTQTTNTHTHIHTYQEWKKNFWESREGRCFLKKQHTQMRPRRAVRMPNEKQ
jgi:hypothetical protein